MEQSNKKIQWEILWDEDGTPRRFTLNCIKFECAYKLAEFEFDRPIMMEGKEQKVGFRIKTREFKMFEGVKMDPPDSANFRCPECGTNTGLVMREKPSTLSS